MIHFCLRLFAIMDGGCSYKREKMNRFYQLLQTLVALCWSTTKKFFEDTITNLAKISFLTKDRVVPIPFCHWTILNQYQYIKIRGKQVMIDFWNNPILLMWGTKNGMMLSTSTILGIWSTKKDKTKSPIHTKRTISTQQIWKEDS